MTPIPDDLEKILNSMQLEALRSLQKQGWTLCFVRRDGLKVAVPVIRNTDTRAIAVIDKDGKLDMNPEINVRVNPEIRTFSLV